ncbi:MAG: hypothetical protein ACXVKL_12415 [Candidatus Angelobacter sp.]
MERFIHEENIRLYRRLLEKEKNEDKRAVIRKLLAEEEARDVLATPSESKRIQSSNKLRG